MGVGDAAMDPHVRDPVGVVDVAEGASQHRLREVEAPATVGGQGGVEGLEAPLRVEPHPPLRVEAMTLARHRHVLCTGQPYPDRPTCERGAEGGHGGIPVGLHLLAAEAATHPQALHRHRVSRHAQHLGDDHLGLRRVLRARLDEDLPGLVDVHEGAVRLEVEVLLSSHLGLTAEHVGGPLETGSHVAALDRRLAALERPGGDGFAQADDGGQRLVVDLHGGCAEAGSLQALAEDPADGVAGIHHLVREERLVALDAGIVDAGHVGRREHTDHPRDVVCRCDPQVGDPGVGVRRLHRVRVEDQGGPPDQVVGVQGRAGDVQCGALVREGPSGRSVLRALRQAAHVAPPDRPAAGSRTSRPPRSTARRRRALRIIAAR